MITADDVLTTLCSNYDTSGYPQEDLLSCCETGLSWVKRRLKKGVSGSDPLIKQTAAAVAHFHFFILPILYSYIKTIFCIINIH